MPIGTAPPLKERDLSSASASGGGEDTAAEVVKLECVARIEFKDMSKKSNNGGETKRSSGASNSSRLVPLDWDSDDDSDGGQTSNPRVENHASIKKSPYETKSNAEDDLAVFEETKRLLMESEDDGFRSVHPDATKIFGPTNAWCLVRTNALIDKSGMVFSQEWVGGSVRGNKIGKIPKNLLLICLVSDRFAKAAEQLLSGLIRDLDVCDGVREAVTHWDMADDYPKISKSKSMFVFSSLKRDSYKCCIFVARAFYCWKALNEESLDDPLSERARFCLKMIEQRLVGGTTRSQKKRKKSTSSPAASAPAPDSPTPVSASKKKKKKETKSTTTSIEAKGGSVEAKGSSDATDELSLDGLVGSGDDEDTNRNEDASDSYVPQAPSSQRPGSLSSSASAAKPQEVAAAAALPPPDDVDGSDESLSALVAHFEKQYEEMKEGVTRMGETLTAIKSRIKSSKQEMRDEVVKEVKRTIMGSFS